MASKPENQAGAPPGANRRRKLAFAILFVAYFFLISWDTLRVPFSLDEMGAIWTYWHPSPLRLLVSHFMLWRGYFRPMGGLFYVPLYLLFGLNPQPYHAVLLVLLLIGAYLMYRFARAMGCGDLSSAIVALIACYHGGLSNLYYASVFVFDVLCGIFYFVAFAYYARIRFSGRLLTRGQTIAFLALYLCALNSKEMAATLPVMLLVYEWLYHEPPPWRRLKELVRWLRGPGRVLCWSVLINLVFIFGKRFGPYGLMKVPSYMPVFSWHRMADFHQRYLGDIFYNPPRFDWFWTIVIWLAVTYLCWRRKRPLLRFCWFWIVVTPLPLEFIIGRDMACLYVPLAGWTVLAATLFEDWLPSATRVVSAEPAFRPLGPARTRTMLAAAGMIAWALGSWSYKLANVESGVPQLEPHLSEVLAEFRAVNPQAPPATKVVFLDDPFPASFDGEFVAELWFRDRKTQVVLNQKTPLPPEEIAKAGAVFTWRDNKLIRIR